MATRESHYEAVRLDNVRKIEEMDINQVPPLASPLRPDPDLWKRHQKAPTVYCPLLRAQARGPSFNAFI